MVDPQTKRARIVAGGMLGLASVAFAASLVSTSSAKRNRATTTVATVAPTTVTTVAGSCSGVAVVPGDNLAAKVAAAPGGTTFCIAAGNYRGGVLAKSGDRFLGEPGAVIDGQGIDADGIYGYGGSTGQNDVTITGLTVRNVTRYAIKAGWRWTVENVEITQAGAKGVDVNTGLRLLRSTFHDLGWYAWSGSGDDMLFEGNLVERANLTFSHPGDNAAVKINGCASCATLDWSERVTFRNNVFRDVKGHGIWTDGPVRDVLVEGNTIERSWGVGIFHEIGSTSTIRANVLIDNGQGYIGGRCYDSAQILVNASINTTVTGNTITAPSGANGICLIAGVRSDNGYLGTTAMTNVRVTDNDVALAGAADSGLVGGNTLSNVGFDANRYAVPDLAAAHFAWRSYPLTWSQFRSAGQEPTGTIQ
jgi:parallel beta-helix repeat protein